MGMRKKLSDLAWWFRYRFAPAHQYHIVRTGLQPGYHDYDVRMLHACMQCLCGYIEEMGGPDELEGFNRELRTSPDQNAPAGWVDSQADRQEEALAIYRWWKIERPKDEARRAELVTQLYGRSTMVFEDVPGMNGVKRLVPCKDDDGKALHDELRALEAKIDGDEQSYLQRLIVIRPSLWV